LVGLCGGGIVLSVKNSSLQVVVAIVIEIFVYIIMQKNKPKSSYLANFGLAAVGHVLFSGYWFVRSYLATGNPVFPFYNHIFRSSFWPVRNEDI
jgi:ABC-type nickel/cobalt efflux system permease component RcnA